MERDVRSREQKEVDRLHELSKALDTAQARVKELEGQLANTEKAYQDKARLWIEQTGAVARLQAQLRQVGEALVAKVEALSRYRLFPSGLGMHPTGPLILREEVLKELIVLLATLAQDAGVMGEK